MRIDAYMQKELASFSRGDIVRALKNKNILCNDKSVKPSYRLHLGDRITYTDIPTIQTDTLVPQASVHFTVHEETPDFLIIDKPRGLQVHPSATEKSHTLANGLLARYPEILHVGDDPLRPGIVHRLDKDTSGLMVVARNQKTFDALKLAFASRAVHKTYYALVWGIPQKTSDIIDVPIARAMSYTRQKVVHHHTNRYRGDAKEAITHYRVKACYRLPFTVKHAPSAVADRTTTSQAHCALVEIQPKTGRMHQIRVHMRHIGHPLLGDVKYETKNVHTLNKKLFATLPPEALATFYLHAHRLSFPLDKQTHTYTSPLPTSFLSKQASYRPIPCPKQ